MIEYILGLLAKGAITGAGSKGAQILIDKLKDYLSAPIAERVGAAYTKASERHINLDEDLENEILLFDDPYYQKLIYSNFNIIDGSELSDYYRQLSKLFLVELFKDPETANHIINNKLDNIQKDILEIKGNTSEIIKMISDSSNLESIQNKLGIPNLEIDINKDDFAVQETIHISKREKTVKDIITELDNCKWLTITGEILSGKTELLKLCINELNKENKQTLFISINKYHSEENIITYLRIISEKLQKTFIPVKSILVIDNLPQLNRNSLIINCLKEIIGMGVKVLSSSSYSLPITIQHSDIKEVPIPKFTKDEVEEIISTFNNNEKVIKLYSKTILSFGRLNPTIISALCYYLDEKNWEDDIDTFMAMLQGDFSTDFRLEINNLLKETVGDASSRELLNRLQIHIGSFKEEIVTLVGNVSPAINNLNDRFLALIGLWIQRQENAHFGVSPLIGIVNKGTPDVANPVFKMINLLLGRKLIEKKKLNQFDIANCILYFNNAEEYDEAGYLLIRALQMYVDKPNLFKDVSYIKSYWMDIPLPILMNEQIKIQIRILQIFNKKNINEDITYLLNDLESIIESASSKGENTFIANSFLGIMYANQTERNPKAAKFLLNAFKESKNIDSEITEELSRLESLSTSDDMLWLTFSQLNNEQDIINWFDLFKSEDSIDIIDFESSNFADACIFFLCNRFEKNAEEGINSNTGCEYILSTLMLIYKLSLEVNLLLISRNILSLIIKLYDLLREKEKAYSLYVENINYFEKNIDKAILHSLIIKVLLFNFNDRVDKLIDEYNSCIRNIEESDKVNTYILDALILLMIYYRDIDIVKSLIYSQLAYNYSVNRSEFDELTQIRVIGEHSYTLWLNGKKEQALWHTEEGYELLLNVYSDSDDYKVLTVKYTSILIRHLYFVICNKEEATDSFAQPSIGLFHLKIDDNKLLDVYHPSRESIAAYMFFEIFNLLGSCYLPQTKKWALTCYRMNKKIDKNPFSTILLHTIPYLAMQHCYNEVVDIFYESNNEIRRVNLGESRLEEIATSVQPERESSLTKIPPKEESDDEFFLTFHLMPLLLNAMIHYIKEKDSKYLLEIKNILDYHLDFCKDPVIIKDCIHILNIFIEGKSLRHNEIIDSNSPILRMIIYFLVSMKSNGSEAFEMQINFIPSLDRDYRSLFKNEYYHLLYPLFKVFWLNKIENNKSEFVGYDHLNKQGINYIENGEGDDLKRLFHVISDHVRTNSLNTEQKNWLDSYC